MYHNKKGYTGLSNLGNTCFLNSCVQALNFTPELRNLFESDTFNKKIKPDKSESIVIKEWINLQEIMWKQNGVVSPNRFVHFIQKIAKEKDRELFTGFAQNDLPEFLLFLIECMHNSISRGVKLNISGTVEHHIDKLAITCYEMLKKTYEKDYSEIMELFYGIYVSELVSYTNTVLTINPEPFFLLNLEIPDNVKTLYDCFDAFTQYELLENENAWFNEKTGVKENVKKRITFFKLPNILIITLKRFHMDGVRKIQTQIDFPLTDLNLAKYVNGYNAKSYNYDLYAVCNHYGGTMGGHYTSFIKHLSGEWVHFNDTKVERHIAVSKIVSPKAYCLFYRKQGK